MTEVTNLLSYALHNLNLFHLFPIYDKYLSDECYLTITDLYYGLQENKLVFIPNQIKLELIKLIELRIFVTINNKIKDLKVKEPIKPRIKNYSRPHLPPPRQQQQQQDRNENEQKIQVKIDTQIISDASFTTPKKEIQSKIASDNSPNEFNFSARGPNSSRKCHKDGSNEKKCNHTSSPERLGNEFRHISTGIQPQVASSYPSLILFDQHGQDSIPGDLSFEPTVTKITDSNEKPNSVSPTAIQNIGFIDLTSSSFTNLLEEVSANEIESIEVTHNESHESIPSGTLSPGEQYENKETSESDEIDISSFEVKVALHIDSNETADAEAAPSSIFLDHKQVSIASDPADEISHRSSISDSSASSCGLLEHDSPVKILDLQTLGPKRDSTISPPLSDTEPSLHSLSSSPIEPSTGDLQVDQSPVEIVALPLGDTILETIIPTENIEIPVSVASDPHLPETYSHELQLTTISPELPQEDIEQDIHLDHTVESLPIAEMNVPSADDEIQRILSLLSISQSNSGHETMGVTGMKDRDRQYDRFESNLDTLLDHNEDEIEEKDIFEADHEVPETSEEEIELDIQYESPQSSVTQSDFDNFSELEVLQHEISSRLPRPEGNQSEFSPRRNTELTSVINENNQEEGVHHDDGHDNPDDHWAVYVTEEGYYYHYNDLTEESTWNCPLGLYLDRHHRNPSEILNDEDEFRECECIQAVRNLHEQNVDNEQGSERTKEWNQSFHDQPNFESRDDGSSSTLSSIDPTSEIRHISHRISPSRREEDPHPASTMASPPTSSLSPPVVENQIQTEQNETKKPSRWKQLKKAIFRR